jgi:hypothetical protein
MIKVKISNVEKAVETVERSRKTLSKANKSALGSTGFYISRKLKQHIKKNDGFPQISKLAKYYKSKYFKAGEIKRRLIPRKHAYSFLSKFARYKVSQNGDNLQIGYGKSKTKFDRGLTKTANRAERGGYQRVTPKMRRFFGKTRFPLSKKTKFLRRKRRRIIFPVGFKVKQQYFDIYKNKLSKYLKRSGN